MLRIYVYGIIIAALYFGHSLLFNFVNPWLAIVSAIVVIGFAIFIVEKKMKEIVNKK
jgi:ABC-type nickel/cobalt efflux system permease component RcnA